MFNRLIRKPFSRLRSFLQAEIFTELRSVHDALDRLGDGYERLRAEDERLRLEHVLLREKLEPLRGELHAVLDQLRDEQESWRETLEQLHREHDGLRATLARLDLFHQTAGAVEDGLLSLALLQDAQEGRKSSDANLGGSDLSEINGSGGARRF